VMSVYKSADPRRAASPWAASFVGPDGRRKLRYCATRKAAEQLLAAAQVAVSRGEYVNPSQSRTVGEVLDDWLGARRADFAAGNLKPATARDYEAIVAIYLRPAFGSLRLRDLSREHVERLRSRLLTDPPEAIQQARAAGLAKRGGEAAAWRARLGAVGARTTGKVLRVLGAVLEEAARRGQVPRNVARGISAGAQQLTSVDAARVLAAPEVARLLDRTDGQFRLMLAMALRTGIRQGEMLALHWADVDLDGQRLHVRRSLSGGAITTTKTRQTRVVPLAPDQVRDLRAWKLACPVTEARLVFPGTAGGFYPACMLPKLLRRAIRRAGISRPELAGFRWHDLRHCFASHALAAGLPLVDVSRLLGHSSPMVTATVYSHVLPDQEGARRAALASLYGGNCKHFVNTASQPA
ncbi:MAG: site-specific integrase, partial [Gammaproteobacteria bacterium]|nr:site-specific integrase [Gammaproteobacteria bacterium]